MIKEFIATFTIMAFFVICIYIIAVIPRTPLVYRIEKVTIDSISVEKTLNILPDNTWTYHTKYGPTATSKNQKIYNIGDTIEIKLVKTKK